MAYSNKMSLLLMVFLICIITVSQVFGASLQGRVVNLDTGEPLIGANVVLVGTKRGASTDLDGYFYIPNVPRGKYELRVSMMGYENTQKNIIIKADEEVGISLKEVSLKGEPVIITASRKEQKLQESPVSVTIAQADELTVNNPFSAEEAVENLAGVTMVNQQVSIRNSSGFAYGTGARVLLLLDGVPVLAGDTGEIKWDTIPIQQLQRVEVVKTAGSALYGSGAMGGVINVITKKPEQPKPTYTITFMAGAYDKPYYKEWQWTDDLLTYHHIGLEHTRKIGRTQLMLSVNEKMNDGFRQANDSKRIQSLGKLYYEHSPESNLTFLYNAAYEDRGNWFAWVDQNHALQTSASRRNDRVYSSKLNSYVKYNRKIFDKEIFYTLKAHYLYGKWFQDFRDGEEKDYSINQKLGMDSQFNLYKFDNQAISLGVEGFYTDITSKIFGLRSGLGGAFFVQDELSHINDWLHISEPLNDLVLTAGGRFDYSYVGNDSKWWQLTPKIGGVYNINNNITLRASGGLGFRTPTMAELFTETTILGIIQVQPNPQLNPEAAKSAEIGGNLLYKNHYIDMALFWNRYEDMIEAKANEEEGTAKFVNLDKARIAGLELTVKSTFSKITTRFNYVFTDSRDLTTGNPLAYRPEHTSTINIAYDYASFGQCNITYHYADIVKNVGGYYTNDPRVPKSVFDVGAMFQFDKYTINAKVKNLFQYNYTSIVRTLAPIRSFDISLTAQY
ncbi:TonB-dependent receptor [bacterium]|nr:TonB-dependent receptor [bacterium]